MVSTTLSEGLQTIVTKAEFVVVNGIVASPFAYSHVAGNLYYQLHRFLYGAAPQLLLSPFLRLLNEVPIPSALCDNAYNILTVMHNALCLIACTADIFMYSHPYAGFRLP